MRSLQTYEGSPANVHRCMEGAESPEMLEVLVLFFFPVSIYLSRRQEQQTSPEMLEVLVFFFPPVFM